MTIVLFLADDSEFETASEGEDESEKGDQGKDMVKTCKKTDDVTVAKASEEVDSSKTTEASATTLKVQFTINLVCAHVSSWV